MDKLLFECLKNENIEYFAVLDYSDCKITSEHIAERIGFVPRSVIVMLLPYFVGFPKNFSVYAASLDYHTAVNEITDRIIKNLAAEYPEYSYKGYGDHSPIDERHAALIGGLGILGKNRLVINEKYGTYFFIAEIITDASPERLKAIKPLPVSHCKCCNACVFACPTGLLRGEGECLSAITQRKGAISDDEAELMRKVGTAWGCDECQKSCPYNENPQKTPIEFFYRDRIESLDPEYLRSLPDEKFSARAFSWRGRKTVCRNVEILFSGNDGK